MVKMLDVYNLGSRTAKTYMQIDRNVVSRGCRNPMVRVKVSVNSNLNPTRAAILEHERLS